MAHLPVDPKPHHPTGLCRVVTGGVVEIEYVGATRTPEELRAAIDAILTEGAGEPGPGSGLSSDDWAALRTGINVRVGGAGFDPTTVAVVVAFAPAANHVVMSLWDDVILPRLRRRLGADALGKERKRKYMLAGIPPEVAASLVLKCVILGRCRLPLNRLTTAAPDAAHEFEFEVALSARRAGPAPPAELLAEFDKALRRRLDTYRAPEVTEFLDDIGTMVAAYAAAPYDPFEEMMRDVATTAASLYEAAGLTPVALRAAVPAELEWYNEPQSSFDFAKAVTAQLEIDDRGQARVKLQLSPRLFDAECVLALPYILVHEYVCHAARLVLGGPPPTTLSSPFTEGWMDYVALRAHERLLTCLGKRRALWPDADGCEDCARRLHDVRHAVHQRDDHIATGRSFGREVARRVDRWFPGSTRRAGPLVGVSARLNGSTLPDDNLDAFVFATEQVLKTSGNATRLAGLLRDSALSPEQLVAGVTQLT